MKDLEKSKSGVPEKETFNLESLVKDIEASKNQNPMTDFKESLIERIKRLHAEVGSHYIIALGKAVEIGQLLTEQKEKMNHGEWMPWLKENMPFSTATARNYMKLWERRETLKMLNVSNLKMAYQVTRGPEPQIIHYDSKSLFDSPRYPNPFSHCDDEQKRKWLAEWMLNTIKSGNPYASWKVMEWTVVRCTFDQYFDESKKVTLFGMKPLSIEMKKQAKKRVNDFLERWKDVDLLKLKFTCLNLLKTNEH